MKKDIVLTALIVIVSVFAALGMIKLLAPNLLTKNVPVDLVTVQADEKVPPFFDNVFRQADYDSEDFIIRDPYIIRAKPMYFDTVDMGPNDILGFRNRAIPVAADIICIGDSQTYGNNSPLERNWPNYLASQMKGKRSFQYSMAVGGWGPLEYLQILPKSLVFRAKVVIVAFYAGNDPMDTFVSAYKDERFEALKIDKTLTAKDAPTIIFPPPESEHWKVRFSDGVETVFTPNLRRVSNKDIPSVKAGWKIMEHIAATMDRHAQQSGYNLIFTIIPTKELVYARKIGLEKIKPTEDYAALVQEETKNIIGFSTFLSSLKWSVYVDVIEALQKAALDADRLYPSNMNGHPIAKGYFVIAQALSPHVEKLLPDSKEGLVLLDLGDRKVYMLVRNGKKYDFSSLEIFRRNGWSMEMAIPVGWRDLVNIPYGNTINEINPSLFGPIMN